MKISSSLSNALQHQHEMINELVIGLSDEKLRKQPEPGKWSMHQHITHLTTYQPVFNGRIELILKENCPSFGRYVASDDPNFELMEKKSTSDVLTTLQQDRKELALRILSLDETELIKTGNHPLFGKMTVADWTRFFVMHEGHHMFALFKLHKPV